MSTYRLRLTIQGADLRLEYSDRWGKTWSPAALYSHDRPPKARTAFRWLKKYGAAPQVVLDRFRQWGCELPAELEENGVVLLMTGPDFVER